MLIRNLDPLRLCNGTRLKIKNLRKYIVGAEILTGKLENETVFIPRIPIQISDNVYNFERIQFPLRLSYAMTINKSQGQTLSVVGIDLESECFSHGQFYVACSRVSSSNSLFINSKPKTKNIVYKEVLDL